MGDEFQFINFSDTTPIDAETRTRIRQHAMRKVGIARRRKGNYGQQNLRQFVSDDDLSEYPLNIVPYHENRPASSPPSGHFDMPIRHNRVGNSSLTHVTAPGFTSPQIALAIPPSTGYERVRIQYDFDVLDLSDLTTFQGGQTTRHMLEKEPLRLQEAFKSRPWSYLTYLPSRYGHSEYLDDALHCLAARVRQYLSTPNEPPSETVMSLYAIALESLQTALSNPATSLEPDVLCATALLAIYELLNGLNVEGWIRHIAGAAAMVKNRGPNRYESDYEKALFIAHVGPIFTESMVKVKTCFLESVDWQQVVRSVIFENGTISDGSEMVLSLWERTCGFPSFAAEVKNLVDKNETSWNRRQMSLLKKRGFALKGSLNEWHKELETLAHQIMTDPDRIEHHYGKRYDILGVYLCCMIFINRLVAVLDHTGREAAQLEAEAQVYAEQLQNLAWEASYLSAKATLFLVQKTNVAHATIETKAAWKELTTGRKAGAEVKSPPAMPMTPKHAMDLWYGFMWN